MYIYVCTLYVLNHIKLSVLIDCHFHYSIIKVELEIFSVPITVQISLAHVVLAHSKQ